jgi:hypothetical protein
MTVNREVRERGERNGSACRRRACRRTGRQRSFKGVQSGRLAGFSAFAFKVRAVQSGGGNRRHAPRRHAVTPTPTRLTPTRRYVFPSLRRNPPARLLDLRSVFFRFSDLAPERAGPLGIAAPFLFARRPALGGLPFPCFFDQ